MAGDGTVVVSRSSSMAATAYGAVIVGTQGPDRIRGTAQADQISALGGNDLVDGERGDDQIDGGTGSDELQGNRGADEIDGYTCTRRAGRMTWRSTTSRSRQGIFGPGRPANPRLQ